MKRTGARTLSLLGMVWVSACGVQKFIDRSDQQERKTAQPQPGVEAVSPPDEANQTGQSSLADVTISKDSPVQGKGPAQGPQQGPAQGGPVYVEPVYIPSPVQEPIEPYPPYPSKDDPYDHPGQGPHQGYDPYGGPVQAPPVEEPEIIIVVEEAPPEAVYVPVPGPGVVPGGKPAPAQLPPHDGLPEGYACNLSINQALEIGGYTGLMTTARGYLTVSIPAPGRFGNTQSNFSGGQKGYAGSVIRDGRDVFGTFRVYGEIGIQAVTYDIEGQGEVFVGYLEDLEPGTEFPRLGRLTPASGACLTQYAMQDGRLFSGGNGYLVLP